MGNPSPKLVQAIMDRRTGLPVKILGEVVNPQELFTLPPMYTDYDDIRQLVQAFRKRVQRVLYDISDGVDPMVEMLCTTDPAKLAKLAKDVDYHTAPGSRMSFDVSSLADVETLIDAITQYHDRRNKLAAAGCRELYQGLMTDLRAKMTPALASFYSTNPKGARDRWLGYKVSYVLPTNLGASEIYPLKAEPRLRRDEGLFKDYETSRAFFEPDGTLHVEFAPRCYGWLDETKLTVEQMAVEFTKRYESALAEKFFEALGAPPAPVGTA